MAVTFDVGIIERWNFDIL